MSILTAFLDTSIVSGLAKEDLKEEELAALREILKQHKQGRVSLVTSHIAKEEIERIPEAYRLRHEIIYSLLADVPVAKEVGIYGGSMSMGLNMGLGGAKIPNPIYVKLDTLLPGKTDARHIFQAAMNNVQYFLTTDVRTILSYRDQIEEICNVKVVSPLEFVGTWTRK